MMYHYPEPNPLFAMVVRAIAAGAGGQKLAAWALEEQERESARHLEEMRETERMMAKLHGEARP